MFKWKTTLIYSDKPGKISVLHFDLCYCYGPSLRRPPCKQGRAMAISLWLGEIKATETPSYYWNE